MNGLDWYHSAHRFLQGGDGARPENCTGSSTAVGHIQKLVRCSTMDHYVHDVMGHQIQENVYFDAESCMLFPAPIV